MPAYPDDTDSVRSGYQAAAATPIPAFAAAIRRSAAAISGRRSNSADGTPSGTLGSSSRYGAAGSANSAGGLPISTAIACSSRARRENIGQVSRAGIVLALCDLQRGPLARGRELQKPGCFILRAQFEVTGREDRLHRQPRRSKIGGAGLGLRGIGFASRYAACAALRF